MTPIAPPPRQQPAEHAMPVGGVPSPPIPPLSGMPTQDGLAMADYAVRNIPLTPDQQRALGVTPGPAAPFVQPPIAGPTPLAGRRPVFAADPPQQAQPPPPPAPRPPMTGGILQTDLLPERAKQDPQYQQGLGSEFAVNQPALAMKYGVIRNNNHIPPQQLSSGRPGLSQQSIDGLAAVTRSMEDAHAAAQEPPDRTPVGAAARLAKGEMDPEAKEKKDGLEALDDLDWMKLRAIMGDVIGNDEQRVIVEERLSPLSIDDLIMIGYVTQEVPIVLDPVTGEKKFHPTFRSTTGQIDQGLKMALIREAQQVKLRGAYFDEKFAMMGACASTLMINAAPLPELLDVHGDFNEEMFWVKFNRFVKLSIHTIASLGVHAFWFDMRVRMLHKAERVKNG